jgi:hypothetical protein
MESEATLLQHGEETKETGGESTDAGSASGGGTSVLRERRGGRVACDVASGNGSLGLAVADLGDNGGGSLGLAIRDLSDDRGGSLGLPVGNLSDNRGSRCLRLAIRDLSDDSWCGSLGLAVRDLGHGGSSR